MDTTKHTSTFCIHLKPRAECADKACNSSTTKTAHTPGAIKAAKLMAVSPKVRQLALGIILREEFVNELAGFIDRETAAPDLFTELEMAHRHIGHLLQTLNGDRRKETKEIDAIADRVPQRMAAIQKARGAQ